MARLNTSHVLIYHILTFLTGISSRFKYISCSYLSAEALENIRNIECLNTSHVLIYLVCNLLHFLLLLV